LSSATSSDGTGATNDSSGITNTTTISASTSTGSGGSGGSAGSGGSGGSGAVDDPCGGDAGSAGSLGAAGEPGSGDQVFFEDFEGGDSRWSPSSDASWTITTDADTGSSVYGNGELVNQPRAAFVAGACFTDVIVEARVKVVEFPGSSTTYVAGPCLRVESEDDYYIVGVQGNGNIGLVSIANGSRSSLQSEGGVNAEAGVWYTLRIEAIGQQLRGYLDGELLLEDTDTEHSFGSFGVCTSNADAVFDEVRVTLP
jgi:pectate lyase